MNIQIRWTVVIPMIVVLAMIGLVVKVRAEKEVVGDTQKGKTDIVEINEILEKEGAISNDGKLFAYIDEVSNEWAPKPYVYIYDLNKDKVINSIEVDIQTHFSPLSWSPKDDYVYVQQSAQYYGGLEGYIFDVKTGEEVYHFHTLKRWVNWVDANSFIFFDPSANCADILTSVDCDTAIVQVDLKTKEVKQLTVIESESHYPYIADEIIYDGIFEFSYSFEYGDIYNNQRFAIELDIKTKKVKEKEKDQLKSKDIEILVNETYPEVVVDSMRQNPDEKNKYFLYAYANNTSDAYYTFSFDENDKSLKIILKQNKFL